MMIIQGAHPNSILRCTCIEMAISLLMKKVSCRSIDKVRKSVDKEGTSDDELTVANQSSTIKANSVKTNDWSKLKVYP